MRAITELCKQLTHGVYVIAVTDGQQHYGAFTAAWVMQVSFAPLMLAFSINPQHHSYALLMAGKVCSVNVLARSQLADAAHFGRGDLADKLTGYRWLQGTTGAPLLANSLVSFDCTMSHCTSAGDHMLVVCNIVEATDHKLGTPMLYSDTGNMDGTAKT